MQGKKLSVLYIHHYGNFGGASKSLFEAVNCFSKDIDGHLISQKGTVPSKFQELDFKTITTQGMSVFDHTVFGYYRGIRWMILLRELIYLPYTFFVLIRARKWKVDLIHINEITIIPALILAKIIIKKPLVVHARVVLRNKGLRYWLLEIILKKFSDHIIAIDKSVHLNIPSSIPSTIIRNGIGIKEIDISRPYSNNKTLKVAMIGGLVYAKGLLDFVEAARITTERGYSIQYIIVGESPTNFDSLFGKFAKALNLTKDIKSILDNFIIKHQLQEVIDIREFTFSTDSLYEEIDVLCFPNHANATGRPVFEAAMYGKPSICTENINLRDGLIHELTGICIESKNPIKIVEAIEHFYLNRDEVQRMGKNAHAHAISHFDIKKNAKKLLEIYNKLDQKCLLL